MADPNLRQHIAEFIAGYRMNRGDPSAMMAAVAAAFPGSSTEDYACALLAANRASRAAPEPQEARHA